MNETKYIVFTDIFLNKNKYLVLDSETNTVIAACDTHANAGNICYLLNRELYEYLDYKRSS